MNRGIEVMCLRHWFSWERRPEVEGYAPRSRLAPGPRAGGQLPAPCRIHPPLIERVGIPNGGFDRYPVFEEGEQSCRASRVRARIGNGDRGAVAGKDLMRSKLSRLGRIFSAFLESLAVASPSVRRSSEFPTVRDNSRSEDRGEGDNSGSCALAAMRNSTGTTSGALMEGLEKRVRCALVPGSTHTTADLSER